MARISEIEPKCAKCGSCAQVCPVFLETGRESHCARGKLHLFSKEPDYSSNYLNSILAKCIQCGACDDICPRDLQPSLIIRRLRSKQSTDQTVKGYESFLTRQILNHPSLLSLSGGSVTLLKKLPAASGLRQKLSTLIPHKNSTIAPPKPSAKKQLLYYPGCLAHYFQTDIEQATRYLASLCGYDLTIPKQATCCGIASGSAGKQQEAKQQALRNINAFAETTGTILTSCGSCYAQLKSYPSLFQKSSAEHESAATFADRVQEFSTFFVNEKKIKGGAVPQTVYYHDPCHLRFGPEKVTAEPRQLIWNINRQGVVNENEPLGCCGQGGLFKLANPALATAIFKRIQEQVTEEPPSKIVTTCSSCLMAWQQSTQNTAIESQHLSVFLAKICKNC